MATDITHFPHIRSRTEFAGILKVEERFADDRDAESSGARLNGWFDRLMRQSGTDSSPTALLMLCVVAAVALGGAAFVVSEHLLLAGIAAVIGACAPIGTAMVMRSRRQSKILKQMPDMVGEMARAARTGRSLEQCVEVVAADTDGPLGDELKLCHRRMQMGLAVDAAFAELPQRTGVVSLSIFTMALAVHQQTGGDLVSVLDRLAGTIRERIGFLGRLKAQTIASRATAVLMLVLPPFILAFFGFRDPEYLDKLTGNDWGLMTLIVAGSLQLIGSIWVLRILRNTRRT